MLACSSFVAVFLLVMSIWLLERSHQCSTLERRLQINADRLAAHMESWFTDRLNIVEQMARLWRPELVEDPDMFRHEVTALMQVFPGMQAVNWIDPSWTIRITVPEEGNEPALGADLHRHPEAEVQNALSRAAKTSGITRSRTIRLLQGPRGIATYRRVLTKEGRIAGFINGVFAIEKMAEKCLKKLLPENAFVVELRESNGTVVYSNDTSKNAAGMPFVQKRSIMIADVPLQLFLGPADELLSTLSGIANVVYPAVGAVLACLFAWLTWMLVLRRQRLEASEARYRALFTMAGDAIFLLEGDVFIDCNSKAAELFRCDKRDIIGSTPWRFSPERQPGGKTSEELAKDMIRRAHEQGLHRFEWVHTTLDGKRLDTEVTLNRLHFGGKDYLLALVRDTTARKEAERRERRLEQQIQQAQKLESLGVLAGGIAHDFNNLLAVILGNSDLALNTSGIEPEMKQSLQEIRTAALQAAELTNQMLAYAGRGHLVVEPVDVNTVIRGSLRLMRASVGKHISLELDLAKDIRHVLGDRTQLRQVLMNLVVNAAEAIGDRPGTITIRTATTTNNQNGAEQPRVLLEVRDTGCGMSDEVRQRLFEPFFTTKFAGRGLGMAAVAGIVRGLQGQIEVESGLGEGTTVRVWLPATEPQHDKGATDRKPQPREVIGKTVLLVDDETFVREVGKKMLERLGMEVMLAENGKRALELIEANRGRIDLVLLDMTMPQMPGPEVYSRIIASDPALPVVLCSGFTEKESMLRMGEKQPAAFLHKPFDLAMLKDVLQKVFSSQAQEEQAE